MRVILQRVKSGSVIIDQNEKRTIDKGLVALVGMCDGDTELEVIKLAKKTHELRIFSDENDKMNLSVKDVCGEILAISNFTLYANSKKGARPSFIAAMRPEQANELYEMYVELIRQAGITVKTGEFGADMEVNIVNDGPVTIILDSKEIM